ncbi:MAG: hypothetical protein H7239_03615 [Flavobacterium sp.]|nr:hypothetical protein [Flavobacterium sp.]
MSNIIQIVINENVNRAKIADVLTKGEFYIDVVNNYFPVQPDLTVIAFSILDAAYKEAFLKVIDQATFAVEGNVKVWNIVKNGKSFDLTDAKIRDQINTESLTTYVDDGTPIKLKIEVPGFSSSNFREIDLWYNQTLNPADVALLAEIGITITGNGTVFSIANAIECKVSFAKPTAILDVYLINYTEANTIIQKTSGNE